MQNMICLFAIYVLIY